MLMWKSTLYAGIAFFIYIIIYGVFTFGLHNTIGYNYLFYQESSIYFILILFTLLYIRKSKQLFYANNSKVSVQSIVIIIVFAFVFRLMEDPILRLDLILGESEFPIVNYNGKIPLIKILGKVLVVVILAPIFEELFFRKMMLSFFTPHRIVLGVIITSFLFSIIHIDGFRINYSSLLLDFIFGLLACYIYLQNGIFYSILYHISYNMIWFILSEFGSEYWKIIQNLNFGFSYWTLIFISYIIFFIIAHYLKSIFPNSRSL